MGGRWCASSLVFSFTLTPHVPVGNKGQDPDNEQRARFTGEFADLLDLEQVGMSSEPAAEGAPSYHPRMLLAAWLYAFMVRIRSSRKVERACAEHVTFMWLTGIQRPDHVALWHFYKLNRSAMRG